MNPKDFRIGNFIQSRHYKGYSVVNGMHLYKDNLKGYQPIPLTEEWLINFGFLKFVFDNGAPNQYRFKNRLLVIRDGFFVDYGTEVKIKYVHKLQNFMYETTGEELTLK